MRMAAASLSCCWTIRKSNNHPTGPGWQIPDLPNNSAKGTKGDLWVLPLEGDRKPFPFVASEFDETRAQFFSGRALGGIRVH